MAEPEPEPVTAAPGGAETVLVVEDEEGVLELAADVLTVAGYRVLSAESPEAALAVSARHAGPIHLMLADVVMPGMSGRELAERFAGSRPEMAVLYSPATPPRTLGNRGVLDPGTPSCPSPSRRRARAGDRRRARGRRPA